jgi:predicted transcriptional regulator
MLSSLAPRERQIVDILYQQGPSVVGEICETLDNQVTGSAVRAMLKRLEDKGFVAREHSERGYLYAPALPRPPHASRR